MTALRPISRTVLAVIIIVSDSLRKVNGDTCFESEEY